MHTSLYNYEYGHYFPQDLLTDFYKIFFENSDHSFVFKGVSNRKDRAKIKNRINWQFFISIISIFENIDNKRGHSSL